MHRARDTENRDGLSEQGETLFMLIVDNKKIFYDTELFREFPWVDIKDGETKIIPFFFCAPRSFIKTESLNAVVPLPSVGVRGSGQLLQPRSFRNLRPSPKTIPGSFNENVPCLFFNPLFVNKQIKCNLLL